MVYSGFIEIDIGNCIERCSARRMKVLKSVKGIEVLLMTNTDESKLIRGAITYIGNGSITSKGNPTAGYEFQTINGEKLISHPKNIRQLWVPREYLEDNNVFLI